jgi:hypothetical protein
VARDKEKKSQERQARRSSSPPTTKPSVKPPELSHDDREIDAGGIIKISLWILAITGAAMASMWWFTRWMENQQRAHHTVPPPMASAQPTAPPDPRLEPHPSEGLHQLRAQEEALLSSYGWENRSRGVVRIPIERAMDLVAGRGLASRQEGPSDLPAASQPSDSTLVTPREGGAAP